MSEIKLIIGDCREKLRELPANSIHTCVTSPPYFGLRDYGTAKWEGGDPSCAHVGSVQRTAPPGGDLQRGNRGANNVMSGDCKCGARRIDSQIGLEPTPDDYVAELVSVFREVRRVLRDDGTLWLNLGDSYVSQGGTGQGRHWDGRDKNTETQSLRRGPNGGLKSKDLVGIPWRVAFALQADGWYLRQDIIWNKPNPMPESVTDRCTKSHEYVFLLSKRPRYFYDAEAIAEDAVREASGNVERKPAGLRLIPGASTTDPNGGVAGSIPWEGEKRNKRSVWSVTVQAYRDAHFATFPPALIEPCIKAGASEAGCCPHCGSPWERIVEKLGGNYEVRKANGEGGPYNLRPQDYPGGSLGTITWITKGWEPSCLCGVGEPPVPCTVLDPFGGAGTTGLVADRLGRNALLIELNPQYADMGHWRIHDETPLFTKVSIAS